MGIVFRQSIKTTIVTLLGAVLGAVVLYLSTILIDQQHLGFSKDLLTKAVLLSQFVLMGMHTTLYVFINKYPPEHRGRSVLITIGLAVPVLLTLFLSIVYIACKPYILSLYNTSDIILVERYFLWLPLYILLWGLIVILEQFLMTQMKIAASLFLKEIVLRSLNILTVLAFGFGLIDFDQFIAYSVLVHIVPVIALLLMARKIEGFRISTNWRAITKVEYKKIFDFAFFHLLLNLSVLFLDYIDILMIPVLDASGLVPVSTYIVGVYIVSMYQIPYRALATSVNPVLNKEYHAGNTELVKTIFSRSSINLWIVTFGMALLIVCNLDNATAILPDEYANVYWVVIILMIGKTVNMLTGLNNEVISISNHYRFNFYVTAILIGLVILLNLYLIPAYGIYGAAWGTTISISLYNIIKLIFLWVKFDLHPFTKGSILVVLSAGVAGAAGFAIPYMFNPIIDTIARSIAILIIYGIMLVWLKPSPDLSTYLASIRKDKKLF